MSIVTLYTVYGTLKDDANMMKFAITCPHLIAKANLKAKSSLSVFADFES